MDEPQPTAAELGISEAEYARILRGLPPDDGSRGDLPPDSPWPKRLPIWVGVVLLAVIVVLDREGAAPVEDEQHPRDLAYSFLAMNGDQPVTYTSCRPIRVAVYPLGGPPDAEQLVREAVATVRDATGLDIVVTGTFGGQAPNWNFESAPVHPDAPISVSWQDRDAIDQLTEHVAGLGGSRTVTNADGTSRWVAGTIALSRDYYARLVQRGNRDEAMGVLLHEFGHVFGLAHVESPTELMYAENSVRTDFGPGDLEGLRRLGQGPCV